MIRSMTALASEGEKGFLDVFKSDGLYAVLGILIVFSVMILLFLVLKIATALISGSVGKKESKSEEKAPPAPAPEPASAPTAAPTPVAASANDGELIAAITAAISMMLEAEGKDPRGFRVVSFRRSSSRK